MAITSDTTTPISFSDIRNEFGGAAPDNLSEYYRGGDNVPNDLNDAVVGATEVQTIPVTGTRSNVVAGATTNELLLIALPNDFNSGGPTAGDLGGSFAGTETIPDTSSGFASWPAGAFTQTTGTVGEWTVSTGDPTTINPAESDDFIRAALFVNNSGGDITVESVSFTILATEAGGQTTSFFGFRSRRNDDQTGPFTGAAAASTNNLETYTGQGDAYTYADGEGFYIGIVPTSDLYLPFTFEITDVSIFTTDATSFEPTTFTFDPDVDNEVYINNSSVVEIDFTNVTWNPSNSLGGRLFGNWRTDQSESFLVAGSATLDELVAEVFVEANTSLTNNVTVTRPGNGNVVRIERSDGDISFWIGDGSADTTFTEFLDNLNWYTYPEIRFGIDGNTPATYDYSDGSPLDTSPRVSSQPLTQHIGTDAALTEVGTAIEAIAPGITWDDTVVDHSVEAVPSSITIDFTNAEYDPTETSFSETVFGNWRENSGDDDEDGEVLTLNSQNPPSPTNIIDEIETEITSTLAAGFTLTRMSDNKLVLAADSGDVTLRINDSSSTSNDDFDFDSVFTTQPIVRVLTPTVGAPAQDGDTELVGNSIEIDYTNVVITSTYSEYFFGNWNTRAPSGERASVSLQGPIPLADIVAEYVSEMNSVIRTDDGFTLTQDDTGLILTLSSASRLSFAINRFSSDHDTFDFESDWITPPVVTQVLPTPGQTYAEDDARVDIGTNAFTGRSITIDMGTQTDIATLFSVIQNGGRNTNPLLVATHGFSGGSSQPQSTYTLTDYNGNVIDTFTRSVPVSTDSDVAAVITQAIGLIDMNTETPVDFTAAADGSNIVITATVEAAVTGTWTLSVNHNNAAAGDIGDIAFGVTSVQDGATPSPATLINQSVPTSGPITTDDFRGAYDPDNPVNS